MTRAPGVGCGWVWLCALGLWLLAAPGGVQAQVWGYVDERGVVHVAAEKIDDRYELFSRVNPRPEPVEPLQLAAPVPPSTPSPPQVTPAPLPALPPRLASFFANSPRYQLARPWLQEAARNFNIDYELLKALIVAESGFDPQAVSNKGAIGLMQVMPATAARWGLAGDARMPIEKKLADPQTNIHTGTRYLRHLINLFPGQLELALAAYNAGEGAVQRAGLRIPNYPETQNYVKTVMQLYTLLKPPAPVRVVATPPAPPPVLVPAAPATRLHMPLPGVIPGRGSMPAPLTRVPGPEALTPLN